MYSAVIEAIAQMFRQFFNWRTSCVDNMAIDEVIDDKRDSEKALRHAEIAISKAQGYTNSFSKLDRRLFNYHTQKFRKFK